ELVPPSVPPVVEAGFVTVIEALPAVAMSALGIDAVSDVLLTKVVASAVPFKLIVAPDTKPTPTAVSVNTEPPVAVVVGDMEDRVGFGLVTVSDSAELVPPVTAH